MADLGRLALYCVVTASTSSALDGSRMRFGDAFRGISRLADRAAGIETPAERRSSGRLYLSAAWPASDTTLSCEPEPPLTPMAPTTLPPDINMFPPRDAMTSSRVVK